MVHRYRRQLGSRNYKTSYTKEQVAEAMDLVKTKKLSLKKGAAKFNIPLGTLWNKINLKHQGTPGHPIALTKLEEEAIVQYIIITAEWGFPLDRMDIRKYIRAYLELSGKNVKEFINNTPSNSWVNEFLIRHKSTITLRTCQNIKRSRAEISVKIVQNYFNNLREALKDIPADNIHNYDETNLSDNPGNKKCVFKRGTKYPERVQDSSKSAISVMFCGSATGKMIPPYVVYKSEHLWSTWCEGGPVGARYGRTKSGWFDTFTFADWFRTLYIPAIRNLEGPKVIIGDNLSSHFNGEVLQLAEENNVKFCCLPPNSTHLCQPLDVAFFAPLKKHWRHILDDWKVTLRRKSRTLTKDEFPALLKKLHVRLYPNEEDTSKNLTAGFEKCGISPFCPEKVLSRLPDYDKNEPETENEVHRLSSSALIEVLKDLRGVHEPNTSRRKRTRINVEAGKSISIADIQPQPAKDKKPKKKRSEDKSDEEESASINDNEPEASVSASDMESESDAASDMEPDAASDKSAENTSNFENTDINAEILKPGTFVLAKFCVKKLVQHFVGKISALDEKEQLVEVNFLRQSRKVAFKFLWPSVIDQGFIPFHEIVRLLPEPSVDRRGGLVFKSSLLSKYKQTLQ